MNIAFVSAILPYPLHSGGQVRLYNLLKRLSKHHEISLYSFIRDEKEREYVSHLSFLKNIHLYHRGYVWQPKYMFRSLTSSLPLLLASYENTKMWEDLAHDGKTQVYDLLHIEPFYVMPSVPLDVLRIPLVVSEHNIEHTVYTSYVNEVRIPFVHAFMKRDIRKIQAYEERAWKRANTIIAVSESDASVVRKTLDYKNVQVIPNGVDTAYFSFSHAASNDQALRFLFVGNFRWVPNIHAVDTLLTDIWPAITSRYPSATLQIVGKHLPAGLQKRAQSQTVRYDAFVDDVRKSYHGADILLAPMTIAGGTKFKILEAMASGTLVLTSREGMEGIDAAAGKEYLEGNTTDEYLLHIQNLLTHPRLYEQITKRARKLIETHYDWDVIARKQSAVWKELA